MADDTLRIEGKVAQILNARELVINRGASDGVQVGMRFAVLNANSGEIRDPDTGEALGSIDVPKVLVKVSRVSDRLAVARTFRQYRTPGGPLYQITQMNDLVRKPGIRIETLQTDETTYKQELDEEESYVHIGDVVREYEEGDFVGWGAAD